MRFSIYPSSAFDEFVIFLFLILTLPNKINKNDGFQFSYYKLLKKSIKLG